MKSIEQWGKVMTDLSDFVKQLDEPVRAEAFKFLLAQESGAERAAPIPVSRTRTKDTGSRVLAPQELIRKCAVTSFIEKAVVLAYWLEHYQDTPTFSSIDLKGAFEKAREPAPKNPSDLVAKLEASARIMKAEKNGAVQNYRLTSTAMEFIEGCLNEGDSK
jgi:hypothetical protein